jgi:hypothetical protein
MAEVDPKRGRAEQDSEDEQPELDAGELKEKDAVRQRRCGRI